MWDDIYIVSLRQTFYRNLTYYMFDSKQPGRSLQDDRLIYVQYSGFASIEKLSFVKINPKHDKLQITYNKKQSL
jgi:hypothetical protein